MTERERQLIAACELALPLIADPAGHRCMTNDDTECERCACAERLREAIRKNEQES